MKGTPQKQTGGLREPIIDWLALRLAGQTGPGILEKLVRRCSRPVLADELKEHARALMSRTPDQANFTRWSGLPADATTKAAVEAARGASLHSELLLGRIDDDGRLLGRFGDLPGLPSISVPDFVERKRFSLDVVLCEDALLIRKDYRGDRNSFVREWAALAMLAGQANVPGIHHVDEERSVLFKNLIIGKTVRELLVANGARILHKHTMNDPALAGLDDRARLEAVWSRGTEALPSVVSQEFLFCLEQQLQRIHQQGITGVSFTWGNVVVEQETNTPWLIDLDKAQVARSVSSVSFRVLRERDCEQYKKIYGRSLARNAPSCCSGGTRALFHMQPWARGWQIRPGISMTHTSTLSVADVTKGEIQSNFMIATSWHDSPVSQQFRALGAELVSRGHRVVLLIDRHNRAGENHTGNPAVFTWPSIRPTRLQDARFVSRIIRQHRPSRLVSNFGAVNLMTLIGWCHGVKHRIVWHHTLSSAIDTDTPHPPWKLALLRWRKRHVWRFATAIAAVSSAASMDLQTRFRIPEAKCHVIYNSLEDPLRGKAVVKTLSGENRILCVARFHHSKGQDVLLRALALLRLELPLMRVEFLGDGPLRSECERLAGELEVGGCCRFAGAVSHERVLDSMAQSDVTVVPSRNEAFGLVALESLAMGTPVVASAVGGIPEIVGDGLRMLLVPPDDAAALAKNLKLLLTNAAAYTQLSALARARFVQEFEQSAAVKRQADWLERLVS